MATKKATDTSFHQEVIESGKPVLVDFWAEWCGPCRQIGPVLEELSSEFEGKLAVVKVNVDENPATSTKYMVKGIPTLMIFKDGQVAATRIGAWPKTKLKEWIEQSI